MWVQLYVITERKTVSAGLDAAHGRPTAPAGCVTWVTDDPGR